MGGIFQSLMRLNSWKIFKLQSTNPNVYFNNIKFGKNGVGWIGATAGWGLGKIENDTIINNYDGFNKKVDVLELDINNSVWIASGSILYKYDGINWNQFDIPSSVTYDMKFDKSGNLWLATLNGLAKFDGSNWEIFQI